MRKSTIVSLGLAALLSLSTVAAAGNGDDLEWYDRFTFGGDLRLRYEHFDWDGKLDDDVRDRGRSRIRLKTIATITDKFQLGFQLRSGNPNNPHSDNQSFDGGFNKKEISIAEAYLDWRPKDSFGLIAGKFTPKSLWLVSDLQWDDDVAVEGAMQNFRVAGSGVLKAFEADTYQFMLEESSSSGDAYLLGFQLRPIFELNATNQLTIGVSYDSFTQPDQVVNLSRTGKLDTEPEDVVTNILYDPDPTDPDNDLELVSDFDLLNGFIEWKNKASKRWPVKLSAFYYVNLGAEDRVGNIYDDEGEIVVADLNGKDNDSGMFARLQVGDYKKPGDVAVRLSRYLSRPDAIFYAWVQSDSRRGSNLDGYRLDLRFGLPLRSHINFTWYNTDWYEGEDTTMNRFQLDYTIKF
jgi:hypothetical protein